MYLEVSDFSSNLIQGMDVTQYFEEADLEVIDLAERLGVRDITDIINPLHYKVKRYAVVFVLMRLAQDNYGTNNPETTNEKYRDLYDIYKTELGELRPQITYEMITGNVDSILDRVCVFNLYRT